MSSRDEVLAALSASDGFVSGEQLAARLNISRSAVWKHVVKLKRDGYAIEGQSARGYRLVSDLGPLDAASLQRAVGESDFVNELVFHQKTTSTNTDALALGQADAPEGTVVVADSQSAGRGRLGRSWQSCSGQNLYMSILLRPDIAPTAAPQLALVAGAAVASTLGDYGLDCRIKWPNDVVTPSMLKVAGILAEIQADTDRVRFVVVGMGINLNADVGDFDETLSNRASSLFIETAKRVDRAVFAADLIAAFGRGYKAFCDSGLELVAAKWSQLSILDGRSVVVGGPGPSRSGVCCGIDNDGALLLRSGNGEVCRVIAGDVTIAQGGYAT